MTQMPGGLHELPRWLEAAEGFAPVVDGLLRAQAATVDGANRWQQFRSITVPSLRPVLLLVITLQVIASFNLVGQPQFMTGGGPGNETRSVLMYVYETGFTAGGQYQLGQASAMALIVAAIMVVVSVINFRVFRADAG